MEDVLLLIFVMAFVVIFYVIIPVHMAMNRGRSGIGWFILNLFITPIWTMIILGILGDCKEKMKKDIIAELRKDNHK